MGKPVLSDSQMNWVRQSVTEHSASLRRYAYSLCGQPELAADAVQETFVRLLKADRQQIQGYLLPWLLRVCRSRVLDLLRSHGRVVYAEPEDFARYADENASDPAQTLLDAERAQVVLARVESLPTNQREVVRLKFLNDLSYKEIAEVTGLSTSNVGFLLHTALKALRQKFDDAAASPASGRTAANTAKGG